MHIEMFKHLNSFSYQNLLGFTFNELPLHALSSIEPILPQEYTSTNMNLKADGFKAFGSYCCKSQCAGLVLCMSVTLWILIDFLDKKVPSSNFGKVSKKLQNLHYQYLLLES